MIPNADSASRRELSGYAAEACLEASRTAQAAGSDAGGTALDTESAQWCLAGSRVLRACTELLGLDLEGDRIHLLLAQCRAGLIAAEECAASCELERESGQFEERIVQCIDACRRADAALRALLTEITPAAGDVRERSSGT
jgi:hypothetical protein